MEALCNGGEIPAGTWVQPVMGPFLGLHSRLSIGDNHVWSVSEQLKEDFVLSPQ